MRLAVLYKHAKCVLIPHCLLNITDVESMYLASSTRLEVSVLHGLDRGDGPFASTSREVDRFFVCVPAGSVEVLRPRLRLCLQRLSCFELIRNLRLLG